MKTPEQREADEAKKDALKRAQEKQEMFDKAVAVMRAQRKAAEAKENERKRKQKKKPAPKRKQNEMKEGLARANLCTVRLAMLCFTGGGEPTPELPTFNPDDRSNTGFEDSLDALIECHNRDKQLFTRVRRLEKWITPYLREDCTDSELTATFNDYFTPKVKAQIIAPVLTPVEAGSLNDLFNQGGHYKKSEKKSCWEYD